MAGRPEGLSIAPIGQGSYGVARPRPSITEEDVADVWNINLNKLLESTKENVNKYGPEALLTKNISWANKPNNSNKRKRKNTRRKNRKYRKTYRRRK